MAMITVTAPKKVKGLFVKVDDLDDNELSAALPNDDDDKALTIEITDSLQKISKSRSVFIDLNGFYNCWRKIPSDILFDALLILPTIKIEWILTPQKYLNDYTDILLEDVFVKLLQWKHQQGLLLCDTLKRDDAQQSEHKNQYIHPFWTNLSHHLSELEDPATFKTSTHHPLILNATFYKSKQYKSKYGVPAHQIIQQLSTINISVSVLSEVLYQSNPSLNVVAKYEKPAAKQSNGSSNKPGHGLLDELSSGLLMNNNSTLKVHNETSDREVLITPFDEYKSDNDYADKMQQFGMEEIDDMLDDICCAFNTAVKTAEITHNDISYLKPSVSAENGLSAKHHHNAASSNLSVFSRGAMTNNSDEFSMLSITLGSDLTMVDYDSNQ